MITLLEYLVVAAVIGAIVFFLAVVVFGRGEQIAPLDPRTAPAELPESAISAGDVRAVRFSMAIRGYRMSDVDWTLDRLGDELDQLRRENAELKVLAGAAEDGPITAPLARSSGVATADPAHEVDPERSGWHVPVPDVSAPHVPDSVAGGSGRSGSDTRVGEAVQPEPEPAAPRAEPSTTETRPRGSGQDRIERDPTRPDGHDPEPPDRASADPQYPGS